MRQGKPIAKVLCVKFKWAILKNFENEKYDAHQNPEILKPNIFMVNVSQIRGYIKIPDVVTNLRLQLVTTVTSGTLTLVEQLVC